MRPSFSVCFGAVFLCSIGLQDTSAIQMQATPVSLQQRDPQTGGIFAPTLIGEILGIWATNVTINNQNFSVLIDMESGGDLWVALPSGFSLENTTSKHLDIGVQTEVGFASVQLGSYGVASQAVSNMTGVSMGLDGMISLALLDLNHSSVAQELVYNGVDPRLGQPFHYNFFDQTPGQDNFIGLFISRTDDMEDSASASFMLNELHETYANVTSASRISLFPPGNTVWSFLVDSISVDGKNITLPKSTVPGTPDGRNVAGLEMSLRAGYMTSELHTLIYPEMGPNGMIFCNTTTTVILYIGGQSFPIHPMDLTNVMADTAINNINCTASLAVQAGDELMDFTLGAAFMRNWYTVFNFGNTVRNSSAGDPTLQMLSITNSTVAAAEVSNIRMTRLSAAAAIDNLNSSSGNSESQIQKYAPIIIGLLGANLLVVLILAVIGLVLCVKRGAKSTGSVKYAPVQFTDDTHGLDRYEDKRYSD
ncbi:hypothetical protein B0H19DRAFT_1252467 [Mycena capillaripes]|nr:hypothetical protein B0H19DRAFT_1252467 [Mycena capillaripes]